MKSTAIPVRLVLFLLTSLVFPLDPRLWASRGTSLAKAKAQYHWPAVRLMGQTSMRYVLDWARWAAPTQWPVLENKGDQVSKTRFRNWSAANLSALRASYVVSEAKPFTCQHSVMRYTTDSDLTPWTIPFLDRSCTFWANSGTAPVYDTGLLLLLMDISEMRSLISPIPEGIARKLSSSAKSCSSKFVL